MRRPPYATGDHAHAVALHPDHGTTLLPITVTACARNFTGGNGAWSVTFTHPAVSGTRLADDNGNGDHIVRRVRGCLRCVVSGAVEDGTTSPVTEVSA